MEKADKCEKTCWWTKAGNCLDYILPFNPNNGPIKERKKSD